MGENGIRKPGRELTACGHYECSVLLFPDMSLAGETTTYLDTLDELDDTRCDEKSTEKGNCPRQLGDI